MCLGNEQFTVMSVISCTIQLGYNKPATEGSKEFRVEVAALQVFFLARNTCFCPLSVGRSNTEVPSWHIWEEVWHFSQEEDFGH